MRSVQNGEGAAYARLLSEIAPLLRQVIRQRRPFLQPADIEDLVQDILLSLHAVRATYDPQRPFLPWFMAIARNRMADTARHHARRAANEVAVERLPEPPPETDQHWSVAVFGGSEALRAAIRDLPRRQRDAVEMLKLREMSLKEAAAISGMTVGSLKVAVHRGMAALRRVLSPEP